MPERRCWPIRNQGENERVKPVDIWPGLNGRRPAAKNFARSGATFATSYAYRL